MAIFIYKGEGNIWDEVALRGTNIVIDSSLSSTSQNVRCTIIRNISTNDI